MYNRNNEDTHYEILSKMLELGADPNAFDIGGRVDKKLDSHKQNVWVKISRQG